LSVIAIAGYKARTAARFSQFTHKINGGPEMVVKLACVYLILSIYTITCTQPLFNWQS